MSVAARPLLVFPGAGTDRGLFLLAAGVLGAGGATPLLLGRREDHVTTAEILGLNLAGARFLFPPDDPMTEDLVLFLHPLLTASAGPDTPDHVRARLLSSEGLYALTLLAAGRADGAVFSGDPASDVGNYWGALWMKCEGAILPAPPGEGREEALMETIRREFH